MEDIREQENLLDDETSQTEDTPAAPSSAQEDNAEKSRLGRKVKGLEESVLTLTKLVEDQRKLLETLLTRDTSVKEEVQAQEEEELDIGDLDEVMTKKEFLQYVEKYLEKREKKKEMMTVEQRKKYETTYANTLLSLLNAEDPDLRAEIQKVWHEKYNVAFTNNPVFDAEKGYLLAKTEVLQKKASSKKSEQPQYPTTGVTLGSGRSSINISPEAYQLAKKLGMSEEDMREAFGKRNIVEAKNVVIRKS